MELFGHGPDETPTRPFGQTLATYQFSVKVVPPPQSTLCLPAFFLKPVRGVALPVSLPAALLELCRETLPAPGINYLLSNISLLGARHGPSIN